MTCLDGGLRSPSASCANWWQCRSWAIRTFCLAWLQSWWLINNQKHRPLYEMEIWFIGFWSSSRKTWRCVITIRRQKIKHCFGVLTALCSRHCITFSQSTLSTSYIPRFPEIEMSPVYEIKQFPMNKNDTTEVRTSYISRKISQYFQSYLSLN